MSSVSGLNLVLATVDLQDVQSVLNAIHRADAGATAFLSSLPPSPVDCYLPRRECCPEPCYLPRRVIHPTPRYLPRPVLHPTPRYESCAPPPPCPKPSKPHITPGPQAPWQMLPWQEPQQPADVIKITVRPPDMLTRGTLIDIFI